MTLSQELVWRGFVKDTTLSNLAELDRKKWVFYCGFDASAPSQTIGNLATLMAIKTFLRHGHQGLILAGGATSLIGDPGGKDKERPLQSKEVIGQNVSEAKKQLSRVLVGQENWQLVNNLDWFANLGFLDFLRDIGKHFPMSQLIKRDFIAQRLGDQASGISYSEFSYGLLQSYDFYHLYKNYDCRLQLGGADQWGNCLSGVDLIARRESARVEVITLPLVVNRATGKKFGKSEDGAVWLAKELTSPYDFYQFWLNCDDQGLEQYLKTYTSLKKEEIEDLLNQQRRDPGRRPGQKRLAQEVTRLVHQETDLSLVEQLTDLVFKKEPQGLKKQDFLSQIIDRQIQPNCQSSQDWPDDLQKIGLFSSQTRAKELANKGGLKVVFSTGVADLKFDSSRGQKDSWTTLAKKSNWLPFSDQNYDFWLIKRGKNKLAIIYEKRN